jgi:hypothetical protein
MSRDPLSIWTVYDHPKDFPNTFVARRFECWKVLEPVPTGDLIISPDLPSLRQQLHERGLTCLPRNAGDDPKIIESWI